MVDTLAMQELKENLSVLEPGSIGYLAVQTEMRKPRGFGLPAPQPTPELPPQGDNN